MTRDLRVGTPAVSGYQRTVLCVGTPSTKKRIRPDRAQIAAIAAGLAAPHQLTTNTLAVRADNFHWMPDASIDLVLTDPPFNIAQDTNFHTWEKNTINSYRFDKDKGWDTYSPATFVELLGDWAKEFARVLRPGGSFAVFCADAYVSHLIDALEAAGLNARRTLTWRKPNAVPINRRTMMMSSCEYVVVGVKGAKATFNSDLYFDDLDEISTTEQVLTADKAAAIVERAVRTAVASVSTTGASRPADVTRAVRDAVVAAAAEAEKKVAAMYVTDDAGAPYLRGCVPNHVAFNSKSGNRLHPTEKPVPLLSYLTRLMSRPGDVILDPFGGSGSTGEAALLCGRRCIVVEQDPEFFTTLSDRLRTLD